MQPLSSSSSLSSASLSSMSSAAVSSSTSAPYAEPLNRSVANERSSDPSADLPVANEREIRRHVILRRRDAQTQTCCQAATPYIIGGTALMGVFGSSYALTGLAFGIGAGPGAIIGLSASAAYFITDRITDLAVTNFCTKVCNTDPEKAQKISNVVKCLTSFAATITTMILVSKAVGFGFTLGAAVLFNLASAGIIIGMVVVIALAVTCAIRCCCPHMMPNNVRRFFGGSDPDEVEDGSPRRRRVANGGDDDADSADGANDSGIPAPARFVATPNAASAAEGGGGGGSEDSAAVDSGRRYPRRRPPHHSDDDADVDPSVEVSSANNNRVVAGGVQIELLGDDGKPVEQSESAKAAATLVPPGGATFDASASAPLSPSRANSRTSAIDPATFAAVVSQQNGQVGFNTRVFPLLRTSSLSSASSGTSSGTSATDPTILAAVVSLRDRQIRL